MVEPNNSFTSLDIQIYFNGAPCEEMQGLFMATINKGVEIFLA